MHICLSVTRKGYFFSHLFIGEAFAAPSVTRFNYSAALKRTDPALDRTSGSLGQEGRHELSDNFFEFSIHFVRNLSLLRNR